GAVFKTTVQALTQKWDDGVCRVPEQRNFAAGVPGRTANRYHVARGIGEKILCYLRHESEGIGKTALKKAADAMVRCKRCKAVSASERKKKDAAESAVNIGQCN